MVEMTMIGLNSNIQIQTKLNFDFLLETQSELS